MADMEMSWHADYQSEMKADLVNAIADFDQALALRPEHVDAWFQKGLALARLGRHEAALAAFEETLQRRPDDSGAWYGKAETLEALKRNAEALAAWDEVLRAPECRTMNFHARQVRIVTGDFRRVRARVSRANALARLGRRAEAVAAYREVIGALLVALPSASAGAGDAIMAGSNRRPSWLRHAGRVAM